MKYRTVKAFCEVEIPDGVYSQKAKEWLSTHNVGSIKKVELFNHHLEFVSVDENNNELGVLWCVNLVDNSTSTRVGYLRQLCNTRYYPEARKKKK